MSPLRMRQRLGLHPAWSRGAAAGMVLFFATFIAAPAAFVAGVAALGACDANALQVQARVANGFADAANRGLPLLIEAYQQEGIGAITAAPDRAAAVAGLDAVRARWRPVWGVDPQGAPCNGASSAECANGAWPALRAAEGAWAALLERQIAGERVELADAARVAGALRAAYCGLRGALPAGVRLPELPALAACGGGSGGAR